MTPHPEQARWFADEVQAHEGALRGYLRGSFPAVRDVDDVVQESYLRVWRARLARPVTSARALLFTVAQRVALDLVRRSRRSPINPLVDLAALHVLEEGPLAADALAAREKIDLLGAAIAALPERCRAVVILHKLHGLPQREVARRLGLAEKTVENQVALGVRRCAEFFREHGIEHF
jgi:RNA polymerase sigma-70 factor (ECF subfamily)